MRIAVVHSFYRSEVSSGENNTVKAQVEALRGAGHEVKLIAQYTDENRRNNPLYPLKAGLGVATGNGYDPTKELEEFRPDIVRVHNLFPNFGTKWLGKWDGPIMATLHNYRPVCANGVLFRDGAICTLCPDGKPLSSLRHACYKHSRLATLPLTIQISKGINQNPVIARADKLVVLSKRSCEAYVRFGVPTNRLVVLPNFVRTGKIGIGQGRPDRWMVASRLSPEKGVLQLARHWPGDLDLDIYGEGEERSAIEALNAPNIRLMGQVDELAVTQALPSYKGMMFPSLTWEGIPGAVLMAFEAGIPVVARAGSAGADLVQEYGFGATYENESALEFAIQSLGYWSNDRPPNLSRFSVSTWTEATERIMSSLVGVRPAPRLTEGGRKHPRTGYRIALIHSFYASRRPSGENVVVNLQAEALANAGHEVKLIARYTDQLREHNPLYPLKAGFDVSTGLGYDPTEELKAFQPDVVWVHNLFPNFSTRWLVKWQGPLIATLYNYRPVCANGVLFRDGAICTLCPDGKPLSALKYGCYKGSKVASIPLTIQISKGLDANPLIARADRIVVASARTFDAYVNYGIDARRLVVIRDFVKSYNHNQEPLPKTDRWVVAARLSPEKGVKKLVEQWPDAFKLDIYGDGEERTAIEAMAKPNVRLMGQVPQEELARVLPTYVGMVFPSIWWETLPNVVLMSLEADLPIVAKRGSSAGDIVQNYGVGTLYDTQTPSLDYALNQVARNDSEFRLKGSQVYQEYFSEDAWSANTAELINDLLGARVG